MSMPDPTAHRLNARLASSVVPAPAAAPSGRSAITLAVADTTRHRVYGYGEHEDVINPGDMLIVSRIGGERPLAQISTYVRGKDMRAFAMAAQQCLAQYEANEDWLSAPVSRVRDTA